MFQLFELILSSPIGAFVVSAMRNTYYAVVIITDCEECGFDDLGKLLLGGFALAIILGIAGSLLWRRKKEKDSNTSSFVSISANEAQKPDR